MSKEHQERINEIERNHGKAMLEIETQARLEEIEHKKMLERIEHQRNAHSSTGKIDMRQFSGLSRLIGKALSSLFVDVLSTIQ